MVSRLRAFTVNLSLVIGSCLVALLFGELALRVSGFSRPNFYVPDDRTGAKHRPNASGWEEREGSVFIEISSQGLRDREHLVAKPPGTFRIAVLGDSFAEGLQVAREETFWAVLEDGLNQCRSLGPSVEVINFGVSGYGTAQELETLRSRVWQYDPDLVLLAFFAGNDVRDNSKVLSREPLRPYFNLVDGRLLLDSSFLQDREFTAKKSLIARVAYAWVSWSRVAQAMNAAKNELRRRARLGQMSGKAAAPPDGTVPDPTFREPTEPAWISAWEVTEALIAEIAGEVRRREKRFVVVTLTQPIQVNPDQTLRERFTRAQRVEDLFYSERRLRGLAARHIEIVPLAPALQQDADRYRVYLHGFSEHNLGEGHWNREGHRRAGELLARYLCTGEALPFPEPQ